MHTRSIIQSHSYVFHVVELCCSHEHERYSSGERHPIVRASERNSKEYRSIRKLKAHKSKLVVVRAWHGAYALRNKQITTYINNIG